MGLFDQVLGALSGGDGQHPNGMMGALQKLLADNGGLEGLNTLFHEKGLGGIFAQWVGPGPNPPITGDQLQGVLGPDTINQLAAQLGMDGKKVSALLAQYFPTVIDQLTPHGKIDPHADHNQSLSNILPGLLQSGLGKLLGGAEA